MTTCLWFAFSGETGVRVTVVPARTTDARGTFLPLVASLSLKTVVLTVPAWTSHLKVSCGAMETGTPVAPPTGLEDWSGDSVVKVDVNFLPGMPPSRDLIPPSTTRILYFVLGSRSPAKALGEIVTTDWLPSSDRVETMLIAGDVTRDSLTVDDVTDEAAMGVLKVSVGVTVTTTSVAPAGGFTAITTGAIAVASRVVNWSLRSEA